MCKIEDFRYDRKEEQKNKSQNCNIEIPNELLEKTKIIYAKIDKLL